MAKILVISPTPTHPQDAGNRARIFSLLSGLKAVGHRVFFAFVKMEVGDEEAMAEAWEGFFPIPYRQPAARWLKSRYDKWVKWLGIDAVLPYRIDDWFTPEISRQLEEIREQVQPDAVLVEYVFLSRAFKCFSPETLKILDTHDIFGDRHRLYTQNNMAPRWFYTTVAQEKRALGRADIILAIQDEEAVYFRRFTEREVITVGHMVQIPHKDDRADNEIDRLLFVGSGNPINVDALNWFLTEVFPLVRRQLPGIELEVVGDCAEKIAAAEGLILTGRVPELAPYYGRAKVVINPVRFGTGLKIKAIEALAYGRPLVTTSAGAVGLEKWAEEAFLMAESPEEFTEAIKRVWCLEDLRGSLTKGASEFIETYNREALRPLLSEIGSKQ